MTSAWASSAGCLGAKGSAVRETLTSGEMVTYPEAAGDGPVSGFTREGGSATRAQPHDNPNAMLTHPE